MDDKVFEITKLISVNKWNSLEEFLKGIIYSGREYHFKVWDEFWMVTLSTQGYLPIYWNVPTLPIKKKSDLYSFLAKTIKEKLWISNWLNLFEEKIWIQNFELDEEIQEKSEKGIRQAEIEKNKKLQLEKLNQKNRERHIREEAKKEIKDENYKQTKYVPISHRKETFFWKIIWKIAKYFDEKEVRDLEKRKRSINISNPNSYTTVKTEWKYKKNTYVDFTKKRKFDKENKKKELIEYLKKLDYSKNLYINDWKIWYKETWKSTEIFIPGGTISTPMELQNIFRNLRDGNGESINIWISKI